MRDGGAEGEHDASEVDGQDPVPFVKVKIGYRGRWGQDPALACATLNDPSSLTSSSMAAVGASASDTSGAWPLRSHPLPSPDRPTCAERVVEADRRDVGALARSPQSGLGVRCRSPHP